MSETDTTAYVARKRCGCFVGMVVDDPKHPSITKRALKEFSDDNLVVERVTVVGYFREHGFEKCHEHSKQDKRNQTAIPGMVAEPIIYPEKPETLRRAGPEWGDLGTLEDEHNITIDGESEPEAYTLEA